MSFFDTGYVKKSASRSSLAKKRTIYNKIIAWNLDKKYYDGKRINGYGGFKYDERWKKFLPKIIKRYKLNSKSKVLDLGCKKGFFLKDLKHLIPGIKVYGIENHPYPIQKAEKDIKKNFKVFDTFSRKCTKFLRKNPDWLN